MATWSLLRSSLDFGSYLRVTMNSPSLYFRGETTTDNIWQYTPATDTLTQIADSTTWAIAGNTSYVLGATTSGFRRLNLCWLNTLYVTVHYNVNSSIRIYRWDGGTTWTVVHTVTLPGDASWIEPRVFSTDGSYIAFIYKQSGGADAGYHGLHSSNGSSWSASSGVIQAATSYENYTNIANANQNLGIVANVDAGSGQDIYTFSAGTWSLADGTNGYYHFLSDATYHWVLSGTTYLYTTDFSTYNTPSANYRPQNSFNMPYSSGQWVTGAFYWMYLADPSPWAASNDGIGDAAVFPALIRMGGGNVYVLRSTGEVYSRDTTIVTVGPYDLTHSAGGIPGAIKVA